MNLTLNDFRNVLGRVNDGNVVMTTNRQGIEKANYGNAFLNIFRTVRTARNDPGENMQLRNALAKAIENSAEGKAISKADMQRIKTALGIGTNLNLENFNAPLSRRELKSIIDMVDNAVEHGKKLVDNNIAAMDARNILDENISNGVKDAMETAACLQPPATRKAGIANVRALFGNDFKGRSPAEMEKFISRNMAVIRQQVFDKLYWNSPALENTTVLSTLMDEHIQEVGKDTAIPVDEQAVTAAFKEVVGELMEKLAAKKPILTKVETLIPQQDTVNIDANGEELWTGTLHGDEIENTIRQTFEELAVKASPYTAIQLDNAAQAVKNGVRSRFNAILGETNFSSQETQTKFNTEMASLKALLNEILADMKSMGEDTAAKILGNVAEKLGTISLKHNFEQNPETVSSFALKTLVEAVKPCSMRNAVENYVNDKFAYVPNKKAVVDFFMAKAANLSYEQRTLFGQYQQSVLNVLADDKPSRNMEETVLRPIADAYTAEVAKADPETIKKMRQERNAKTFDALLKAMPGYTNMSDAEKTAKLISLKIGTLVHKIDYDGAFKLGITKANGSTEVKTIKVDGKEDPDPEALKTLDEQLLNLDDKEFELMSQIEAKNLRTVDANMVLGCKIKGFNISKPFETAIKDGSLSPSNIPFNSHKIIEQLIYANLADISLMNGEEYGIDTTYPGMREMRHVNKKDAGPLTIAMHTRLCNRLAATGKQFPASYATPTMPGESEKAAHEKAKAGLDSASKAGYGMIRGFGTMDVGRIFKLFQEVGLDLTPLDGDNIEAQVDVYEKVLCLSTLSAMNGHKLDGLAEFAERVTGKSFDKVTYTDVVNAMIKNKVATNENTSLDIKIKDPLEKLEKEQMTLKQLFAGEMALPTAKLPPQDAASLLKAARELQNVQPGTAKSLTVKIKGENIELSVRKGGELCAKVGGLPMRAALDAHTLVRMLENEITTNPNNFTPEVVKSTLPSMADVKSGNVPLVRARELFAKVVAAKTGLPPVQFSSYTTEKLRAIALDAADGKQVKVPTTPPQTYNSGAMLEMHANLARTSVEEVNNKVHIATTAPKDINLRRTVAPDPQTVRNVVADLFLNQDTWAFDAGQGNGERIRKLIIGHEPELAFILQNIENDQTLLSNLPQQVREAVKDVFRDIGKLNIDSLKDASNISPNNRSALAAIETKIAEVADKLVTAMQDKVTALFEPKQGEGAQAEKPDWQKTFAELTGKEGIDVKTKQGAFTMKVLKNYFKNSAMVDKRAMLSAFIRNTDETSSDAKQVAELLKGAGPLLQKMLQGLPLTSFNAETQIALKDMKSRLLPIPDEAVKAQMLELVNSSNGNILSIDVKKSLGAATVGQAFLCTIKTKEHPNIGVECVVKLLRPNVDTAIIREKALIDKLIGDDQAMKATFDGQYRKILEEFDLTLESTNVGIGMNKYEKPGGVATVHSMQILEGTTSTMTSMIVKKADGLTLDATIDKLRNEANDILEPLKHTSELNGVKKTVFKAANFTDMLVARRSVLSKVAQLNDRRNHVLDVAKAWFENAIFGNGFFHGDLHGGNLMTGLTGTTFIDFGNCSRLSPAEQKAMKMMFATIVSGDVDKAVANFKTLLPDSAKAAFDKAFPAKSKALENLTALLKRGTASDMMPRLQAFVAAVQGADVQIPQSLQNFVQSYMRLSDIVADIDRTVEDLTIQAASIYCDVPKELEPVEGEPKFITVLKPIVKAFIGTADTPYTPDAVRQAANEAQAYLNSDEGKAEVNKCSHDMETVNTKLRGFYTTMKGIMVSLKNHNLDVTKKEFADNRTLGDVYWAIHNIDLRVEANTLTEKYRSEQLDKLEKAFLGMPNDVNRSLNETCSIEDVDGFSSFYGTAASRKKSMTDICSDVIDANSDNLQSDVLGEFGVVGALGFVGRIKSQYTLSDAMDTRRKKVGPQITKLNDALPPGERVPAGDLAKMLRATRTFFAPSPRPDANAGWVNTPAKRAELLNVISYNLSRAAEAVGQKNLSTSAVKFVTQNFGIIDSTLVNSIAKLSEAEYATLLLDAQKIDGNSGGNELATALATLRSNETAKLLE